ncbi:MAG: hypothetical protein ACPHK2_03585, partial [Candidatus Poseidoniaceae archaeon]
MGEINSDEDTSSQVDDELVQDKENVTLDEVDVVVETIQEEADPLEQALARAEKAEKEIAYKEAEIQNV